MIGLPSLQEPYAKAIHVSSLYSGLHIGLQDSRIKASLLLANSQMVSPRNSLTTKRLRFCVRQCRCENICVSVCLCVGGMHLYALNGYTLAERCVSLCVRVSAYVVVCVCVFKCDCVRACVELCVYEHLAAESEFPSVLFSWSTPNLDPFLFLSSRKSITERFFFFLNPPPGGGGWEKGKLKSQGPDQNTQQLNEFGSIFPHDLEG